MKKLKIVPKGIVSRYNTENGTVGECSTLLNMRERNEALECVGKWKRLGEMSGNERLMLVERRKDADYYMSADGVNVYLYGTRTAGVFAVSGEKICSLDGNVMWMQNVGRFIVIGTTQGRRYLYHNAGGEYVLLNLADAVPQIVFGATNKEELSETVAGMIFNTTYTQWLTLGEKDKSALKTAVLAAGESIEEKAKRKGAYVQPVTVRYALRLWDDTYAWVSAPVVVGCGVQLASLVSAEVDSAVTCTSDTELTATCFNVGATMLKPPSEEWLPLVKSIDILASDEMKPFVGDRIMSRCETSDSVRYVTFSFEKREAMSASSELMNPETWHILSSITDFDAMNGNTVAVTRTEDAVGVSREELSELTRNINHEVVANSALSLNGRLYSAGHKRKMLQPWQNVQSWGGEYSGQSCSVIVTAVIRTEQGDAVKTESETYDYTPACLNALIAYPDARAKELSVKILCGDAITEWSGTLTGCDSQGFAYFLNDDIVETELSQGYSFYAPTEQNTEEPAYNEFTASVSGNPFVTEQRRDVGQGEILSLAAVAKSVYSSVFGRYPVYAFTSEGIYAVAYKELGDYKDAQLIDRHRLGEARAIAVTGDKVYFVSSSSELCYIAGKEVTELDKLDYVSQIVWVNEFNELLVRYDDNIVNVIMPDGRRYERDAGLRHLYGDFYDAYALDIDGYIVDLNRETGAEMTVVMETFPVAPKGDEMIAPVNLSVNVSGEFSTQGQFTLSGVDGVSCDWRNLSEIALEGVCCHPITERVYASPCRLLKLWLFGTAASGTMLRDVTVKYL